MPLHLEHSKSNYSSIARPLIARNESVSVDHGPLKSGLCLFSRLTWQLHRGSEINRRLVSSLTG